jgi:hypothetical protein
MRRSHRGLKISMTRRLKMWIGAAALSPIAVCIALPFISVAKGIGRKTLEVIVCVIET